MNSAIRIASRCKTNSAFHSFDGEAILANMPVTPSNVLELITSALVGADPSARPDELASPSPEGARELFGHVQHQHQRNLGKIIHQAANDLPATISSKRLSSEWTVQFLTSAQEACDPNTQVLWARILAGEITQAGSYSRRTMHLLRILEPDELGLFRALCRLAVTREQDGALLAFWDEATRRQFSRLSAAADDISPLADAGLVHRELRVSKRDQLSGSRFGYFGTLIEFRSVELHGKMKSSLQDPGLPVCAFTKEGSQLWQAVAPTKVEGYLEQLGQTVGRHGSGIQLRIHNP